MVTSFNFADISALVGTDVVVPPTVTGTGCTVNLDTLVVLEREMCLLRFGVKMGGPRRVKLCQTDDNWSYKLVKNLNTGPFSNYWHPPAFFKLEERGYSANVKFRREDPNDWKQGNRSAEAKRRGRVNWGLDHCHKQASNSARCVKLTNQSIDHCSTGLGSALTRKFSNCIFSKPNTLAQITPDLERNASQFW